MPTFKWLHKSAQVQTATPQTIRQPCRHSKLKYRVYERERGKRFDLLEGPERVLVTIGNDKSKLSAVEIIQLPGLGKT